MVILNLYEIPFHAVVVFRTEQDILFKSTSTYCGKETFKDKRTFCRSNTVVVNSMGYYCKKSTFLQKIAVNKRCATVRNFTIFPLKPNC